MRKRALSILLIVCMILTLLPTAAVPVKAEEYTLTFNGTQTYPLPLDSGTVLLDGLTSNSFQSAIIINGNVTLVIKGTVSLNAAASFAGIQVLSGKSVTIKGYEGTTNKLIVRGGNANSGGNGGNGGDGSGSGGGAGGTGGTGGSGGGAAIGSNGGISKYPNGNNCYQGEEIGTVNIDSSNLSLDLQGGNAGYGGYGGGGGDTSDPGKSGGGGGGGGGGGFYGPTIGRGGANGTYGGVGGNGVSVSGAWGAVGGGGGGAGGYGYNIGGGGSGGRGACYNWSGTNWAKSGWSMNNVSPGGYGIPRSSSDSNWRAYIDDGNFAYPGQGGDGTMSSGVIYGGSGGVASVTPGQKGPNIYPNSVTITSYKTICFSGNGGSTNSYSMTTGNTVGTLPNPTREGYNFMGWNPNADGKGSTVTTSTILGSTVNTYYAVWALKTYDAAVTVQKNGEVWTAAPNGTVVLSTSSTSALTGQITATSSSGVFTFGGIVASSTMYVWAKNKAGTYVNMGSVSASGTTFTVNYYDVNLSGGTGIQSVSGGGTYLGGETATISAVLTDGYNFTKWSDNNTTMTGRTFAVNAKTDLTASAAIIPVYAISADKTTLDFGSLASGYTQPSAVTVIITNTGNQNVTLTQPKSNNYIIGSLSKISLSLGESSEFTIRPKAGLIYGNHDEAITVSTSYGVSATTSVKFSVLDNTPPTAAIKIGSNSWNSFLNTVTFGLFFKQTKTVTVTANDTESGIKTIEYLLSATKFDSANAVSGAWKDITSSKQFNIDPNSKQYIYVRAVDNGGNVSVINTDGVVIYTDSSKTAPEIIFTRNGTDDISTQVTRNGNTVKEIKNGSNVIDPLNYTVDTNGKITFKASYLNTLAADSYTLTVFYDPMGETYQDTGENVAPGTTDISLTVQKADGEVKNISNIGKTYDGNAVSAPTYNKPGTGTATIEYKVKDAADSTYTATAPQNAGDYTVRVTVTTDDTYKETSGTANFTIAKKEVTITGASVDDSKVYDGNTTAKIKNTGTILGNYDGGNLTIKAGTAAYATKDASQNKTVTFTAFALSGPKSSNYTLTAQPASVVADITPKPITVSGITAKNKIYDGNDTVALVMPTLTDIGVAAGDAITVSASGLFDSKDTGSNKTVNISGITLSGADADNYLLAVTGNQAIATASINRKAIVVTPDALSKNVGQTDPAFTYMCTDAIPGEISSIAGKLSRTAGETAGSYPYDLGTLTLMDKGAFKESNYRLELLPETYKFTINKVLATTSDYEVTGFDGAWNTKDLTLAPKGDYVKVSTDGTNWSDSLILNTEGAASSLDFYLLRSDGSITDKTTYTYKLDKTAPTGTISQGANSWKTFLNTITFGLFFKETKSITVTGADTNGSGVAFTGYYVLEVDNNKGSFDFTLDQAKAFTYTEGESFNINPERDVIVFAKIVDNAGNVTYINSQGMVLEETAPVISGITAGETYYTTRRISVTDKNLDHVTVNGEVLSGNTIAGNVDKTYTVVATDKAGNSTTCTFTMKTIGSLTTTIDSLNIDNVRSSDKATIAAVKEAVSAVDIAGATQAEKDKLKAITDKCDALLARISAIASDIVAVTAKLGDTTKDNAKSSDSTRLAEVKAELERLLGTDNLTDAERANLEAKLVITNDVITEITKVANEVSAVTAKLGDTTKTNAKSSDSTRLLEVKAELVRLLNTENLTNSERVDLEAKLTITNEAIAEITKVANEISAVTAKLDDTSKDNAKSSDSGRLAEVKAEIERLLGTQNLTNAQRVDLEAKLTTTNEAITEIAQIVEKIADVNAKTDGITTNNVKSSDKPNLESALTTITDLLATNDLTDGERAAFEQRQTDAKNALQKIAQVAKAIADAIDPVKDKTKDNVTKEDRTKLEKAVKNLQNILDDYNGNLTNAEKEGISGKIKLIQDIIKVITDVNTVEDLIENLPEPNAVKKTDLDSIGKAYDEYKKLTDHGKGIVDPTLKTKLDDVIKALRKLFVVHEDTGTKVEGIDGTDFDVKTELMVIPVKETLGKETQKKFALSVASAAKGKEIAQLYDVKLLLNGQPIQPDGKVKITLKLTDEQQNYKDLQVIYIAGDGTVTVIPCEINGNEVSFITDHFSYYGIIGTPIKPGSGDKTTPDTGDNTPIVSHVVLAFLSVTALAMFTKKRKSNTVKK